MASERSSHYRSVTRIAALCFVGALLSATGEVHAQPHAAPSERSSDQREAARQLMDTGRAKMKEGKAQDALEAFQKADDIMHVPTTGLWVARADVALGRLVEARRRLSEVARAPRDPSEPEAFKRATESAATLEHELVERIPTVRIIVKNGASAHVTVDGVDVPPAALAAPFPVNPGRHTVVATSADGKSQSGEDTTLAERDAVTLELDLQAPTTQVAPLAPALPPPPTPPPPPAPAPVVEPPAPPSQVAAPPEEPPDSVPPGRRLLKLGLTWGGFAAAGVGLVGGTITGIITLSTAGRVKATCAKDVCSPSESSDLQSARSLAVVTDVAIGVGVAGLAVGAIGLLLPPSSLSRHAASLPITPWIGPTSIGAAGTF